MSRKGLYVPIVAIAIAVFGCLFLAAISRAVVAIRTGRVELHREKVQELIRSGKAYYCVCTPDELEGKRKRALAEGRIAVKGRQSVWSN